MTKEDRAAFLEWKRETAGDTTILIRPLSGPSYDAWQSACAYKDKRIAEPEEDRSELQKVIDLDTERFSELGEEIQDLKERIAELEAKEVVHKEARRLWEIAPKRQHKLITKLEADIQQLKDDRHKAMKRIAELEARVKELHDFNLVLCNWSEGDTDE